MGTISIELPRSLADCPFLAFPPPPPPPKMLRKSKPPLDFGSPLFFLVVFYFEKDILSLLSYEVGISVTLLLKRSKLLLLLATELFLLIIDAAAFLSPTTDPFWTIDRWDEIWLCAL